jgi:hypothetical protein
MKYTNKHNLPECFVNALKSDNYDYKLDAISVTTLIDSPYIARLKKEHYDDVEEDVIDNTWKLIGSSIHELLEKSKSNTDIIEHRMEKKIDGTKVRGKFDLYEGKTRILYDYKITSVWSVIYKSRLDDWIKQLNCYAYLFDREIRQLKIITILRDWTKSKKNDNNYPRNQISVINLNLWDRKTQENYIKKRLYLHNNNNGNVCSPEERWQKPTTYAVKLPRKKNALRVLKNEEEAKEYIKNNKIEKGYIEIREGQDVRCQNYCSYNLWCEYYKKKYKN